MVNPNQFVEQNQNGFRYALATGDEVDDLGPAQVLDWLAEGLAATNCAGMWEKLMLSSLYDLLLNNPKRAGMVRTIQISLDYQALRGRLFLIQLIKGHQIGSTECIINNDGSLSLILDCRSINQFTKKDKMAIKSSAIIIDHDIDERLSTFLTNMDGKS